MPTQQYTNTNYISLERSHLVDSIMAEIYGPNQNIQWQFELPRSENRQKFLGWLTVLCSQMRQVFINILTISGVSKWSVFPSLENLEMTKGSAEQILRNRRHCAKNRILTLYRMTAKYMCTLDFSSLLKNCNTSRVKIKSAIFLQMSYRFEWHPIFIHYLNL